MATLSVLGKMLVNPEELYYKQFSGDWPKPKAARETVETPVSFSNGNITLTEIREDQKQKNFQPIGIGKPLSVDIVTIYAGSYQKFLGGKKDLAVCTGVKSTATYDAATRAVNRIERKTGQNQYLEFEALAQGTPIVYYSPAMDADAMTVTFEMMFDNFDTTVFDAIAKLLNTSAGIPVFMPAAPYLLGASQLLKLGAGLGNTLFAGKPNLKGSVFVNFQSPVLPPTVAREFVIFNDNDAEEFSNLESRLVNQGGNPKIRLVDKQTGKVYKGPAPYMIVTLDGAERNLAAFTPKLATAALLKKFYGGEDTVTEVTAALEDALRLYNDYTFLTKGERLKKQLADLSPGTPAYNNLKLLYDTYAKNIQTEALSLPKLS